MKALISFGLTLYRDCAAAYLRVSRVRALFAWWWMLRSRRYIVLRNLVIQTPGAAIHVGLVVVSTRGLFIVETLDARQPQESGSAHWFECGRSVVSCYDDPMHHCAEQARQIADVIEENVSFVSPVLLIADAGALPEDRPAHLVSGRGLVDYIRSFRVEVFSSRRTQQIVSQLSANTAEPVRLAA